MANYTEAQLNAMEEGKDIRPRAREAGRLFLLQDEGERSYQRVTPLLKPKSDGDQPTQGRVDVYIREYLTAIDATNESPRPGRKANGGNGSPARVLPEWMQVVKDAVDRYKANIDDIETRLSEYDKAVADFDADAFKVEVAEEFEQQIAELTARLNAWQADEGEIATKSATKMLTDLTARRDRYREQADKDIEFLRPNMEQADATLQTMVAALDAAGKPGE